MSNLIRRLLQELEEKITEPTGAAAASETNDTGKSKCSEVAVTKL